jgi:hypothetical protein
MPMEGVALRELKRENERLDKANTGLAQESHEWRGLYEHGLEDRNQLLESNKRLRAALERSADTFRDVARVVRLVGRPLIADACMVAEDGAREALGSVHEELPKPRSIRDEPQLCGHDDPSWCTAECAEKVRKFREYWGDSAPNGTPNA